MEVSHKRSHESSAESCAVEPVTSRPRTQSPNPSDGTNREPSNTGVDTAGDVHETLSVQQVHELAELWDDAADVEVLIASYLAKKLSKELAPTGNEPVLQEAIEDSKRVEWDTLIEKRGNLVPLWERG